MEEIQTAEGATIGTLWEWFQMVQGGKSANNFTDFRTVSVLEISRRGGATFIFIGPTLDTNNHNI